MIAGSNWRAKTQTRTQTHARTQSLSTEPRLHLESFPNNSARDLVGGLVEVGGNRLQRATRNIKRRGNTPCSNNFQMHEPMPAPWCFSSPPPFLSSFARIHPLLGKQPTDPAVPALVSEQIRWKQETDKHRLIAHRQRLETGWVVCGGTVSYMFRNRMAGG